MDSIYEPSKTMLPTVGPRDEGTQENSCLPAKDSLIFGSKPKIQLIELAENIKAAETQYDSVKMQWDYVKNLRSARLDPVSPTYGGALSQNSVSSSNSLKQASSENSIQREDEAEEEEPESSQITELRAEVTHISQKTEDVIAQETEAFLSNLNLTPKDSAHSVHQNTTKKVKKVLKTRKRSLANGFNDDANIKLASAKTKRKKFRVKNTNSKSTVTTRDTNFSDKKRKIRKQKSADAMSAFKGSQQTRKKSHLQKMRESSRVNTKEFVEIYHNSALKSGGFSIVPAESEQKFVEASTITRLRKETDQATGDREDRNDFTNCDDDVDVDDDDNLPCFDLDSAEQEKNEAEVHGHAAVQHACGHNYYDFFTQRNYEMPTMASKMKRVHRPCFNRYNIRNIPFVVSTSLSPSHNLGLNIQQVLSIIKTRQDAIPGVSPVLIRKISQGMRPVSTLFEGMNANNNNQLCRNFNDPNCSHNHGRDIEYEEQPVQNQVSSYKQPNLFYEPLYEVDEETRSTCSDQEKTTFDSKPDANAVVVTPRKMNVSQQQAQKLRMKKTKRFSELGSRGDAEAEAECNYPSNNKEMAEVFSRLYDQFDKMISQHDKLKDQYDKRKDKSLSRELSELEEAIEMKEQEISAVVNLYKEVMSLKQQMKLMHERNSFVCITTEQPGYYARSPRTPVAPNHHKSGLVQETNSLRLAGLLKQIQAFQKQISIF